MSATAAAQAQATGGGGEYVLDNKLAFRVRQYAANKKSPTEDGAVAFLLDKYKEYARKPQVRSYSRRS